MKKDVFLKIAKAHATRGYAQASLLVPSLTPTVDALLEKRWLSSGAVAGKSKSFTDLEGFLSVMELSRATPGESIQRSQYSGPYEDGNNPQRVIPFYPVTPYGLEALLEEICPDIRYLQFRAVESQFVRDTVDIAEFYGDRIYVATQFISFEALWKALIEKHLVEDDAS